MPWCHVALGLETHNPAAASFHTLSATGQPRGGHSSAVSWQP